MEPRERTREVARGALYLVSLGLLIQGVHALVGSPLTSAILGAVLVSFAVGRAGVANEAASRSTWTRFLRGAACGIAVAALALAVALLSGGHLRFASPGTMLWFSLVEAAAIAYRDELWLHGIPLVFAWRAAVPDKVIVAYGALASAAVVAWQPGAAMAGVALSAASGAFFTLAWLKSRDAWAPIGAHFAWAWASEALLSGELFDLQSPSGRLARGLGASGLIAWACVAAFVALIALTWRGFWNFGAAILDSPESPSREKSAMARRRPER
jgi:hypothetical protein